MLAIIALLSAANPAYGPMVDAATGYNCPVPKYAGADLWDSDSYPASQLGAATGGVLVRCIKQRVALDRKWQATRQTKKR